MNVARQPKEAYDLTDAEKRDLTQLIQQGKPLPEKYRFILFEDKREVELVWNGKNREVCTTVLPFQSLEHVDEPRQETPEGPQIDLFDTRGRQTKGWTNTLIWGDNKLILSSLKSGALRRQIEGAGGLKLIYIDPPFDVGADFSMDIEIGGETFHKEPNLLEQIAYRDTWGRGADSFISMLYERLILMRDLLTEDVGIHTTRKRLIQVQRELKDSGKPFRAFEVLNLGRYERQAYLNVGGRLTGKQKEQALAQKEREFRDLILRAYKAQPLENEIFFHGKNAGRLVVVGPINLPVGRLFVEGVITECRKRGASRVDVLAFEFEMGLFPAALDEAKQKGIDLTPKTIPPEVFDKRAVDKGQVRFHDISFVEATSRYAKPAPCRERGKDKLILQIELTDFSVYYTQGLLDAVAAELKEGKSDVVCDLLGERGQLIKVSKDKQGVVTTDVLTKHWTDWVDYWAVDFDYMSRKEIIKVSKSLGVEEGLPSPQPLSQRARGFHSPLPSGEGPGVREEFEERWTGGYIFENEWQSFRTRQDRKLELTSAPHAYTKPGRDTVAVKVIDIFGNDTMTLVPVSVG